jgi:hypothetical protein
VGGYPAAGGPAAGPRNTKRERAELAQLDEMVMVIGGGRRQQDKQPPLSCCYLAPCYCPAGRDGLTTMTSPDEAR